MSIIDHVSGLFKAVRFIYTRGGNGGGIWALYRGHSAMLARIFPYAAINYAAHERLKGILQAEEEGSLSPWRQLLAGSAAGSLAVLATYPFDIVRSRLAYEIWESSEGIISHRPTYWGVLTELAGEGRRRWRQGGFWITGFYQGILPTLLGIIPYAGVSFATYETLKGWHVMSHGLDAYTVAHKFLFGLVSGALGQTIAYPLDVVRHRLQLYTISGHLPPSEYERRSVWSILRGIGKREGVRGLFRGLHINYLKVAPATGLSFVCFEYFKGKFKNFSIN